MDVVTDFPLPPENMLSEQIALPEHRLAMGLIHPEGEPAPLIYVWDGEMLRRVSNEAARRWASEIEAGPFAEALIPVAQGLRTLADKSEAAVARALFRRAGKTAYRAMKFADMPVEGHA